MKLILSKNENKFKTGIFLVDLCKRIRCTVVQNRYDKNVED